MELTKAAPQELEELLSLYRTVADHMEQNGSDQWHWGDYPNEEIIREDVALGRMYVLRSDVRIVAAVALIAKQDPEYETISWTCGIRPAVFHRLAIHPEYQGLGIGADVLDDVHQLLRRGGFDCVRCDTYIKNTRAIRLYEKMGFRFCGNMKWDDGPRTYVCYDKPLMREAPLMPIRMTPAFRAGGLTPWGGRRLKTVYHKDISVFPAGESLECSALQDMESTDRQGNTLTALSREFGQKLTGRFPGEKLPLLLKLIDAKEKLSVQVHPDDEYAFTHENGKFGKTEAWLILDAEKGAELVCGLKPGTERKTLEKACEKGAAVEKLLRRVPVRAGDVVYIPAGCVHSIGAGIMLYEIQESSDLTYRFYDWDRTDAQGRKRPLHIKNALAVTDPEAAPEVQHWNETPGCTRMIESERFTLDLIRIDGKEKLPAVCDFGFLTALDGKLTLAWPGGQTEIRKGESFFLPAQSPELTLAGKGKAALSMPVFRRTIK